MRTDTSQLNGLTGSIHELPVFDMQRVDRVRTIRRKGSGAR